MPFDLDGENTFTWRREIEGIPVWAPTTTTTTRPITNMTTTADNITLRGFGTNNTNWNELVVNTDSINVHNNLITTEKIEKIFNKLYDWLSGELMVDISKEDFVKMIME